MPSVRLNDKSHDVAAARWVIAAGVAAAMHVGKLPPAVPVLQQVLGISLLQAGFLLSLFQLAGMTLGLVTGLAVQRAGLKRSVLAGLLVLAAASAAGALADGALWLLVTRAVEGFGFLLVVLPAPALIRQLVPPARLSGMLGAWGGYMPLGTALAMLVGPGVMHLASAATGWRLWWCLLALLSCVLAALVAWRVPPATLAPEAGPGKRELLAATLRSRAAWLMALTFAVYAGQWLAVIGFLPSVYAQAGVAGAAAASLTALAAGSNVVGNLAAGRLLSRGASPVSLLVAGFVSMGVGALVAFDVRVAAGLQYGAVLVFSMAGGLIPATVFNLAVRLATGPGRLATTIGWIQQWSALGQFAGPPLVAWMAVRAGGWQATGWVTAGCCGIGLLLAWRLQVLLAPARVP